VENPHNTAIPIWMSGRLLFVFMGKYHEVWMRPCIEGILVPSKVIGGVIYTQKFVRVEPFSYDIHVSQILVRKIIFIATVRYAE
jgi:hypothetical protein